MIIRKKIRKTFAEVLAQLNLSAQTGELGLSVKGPINRVCVSTLTSELPAEDIQQKLSKCCEIRNTVEMLVEIQVGLCAGVEPNVVLDNVEDDLDNLEERFWPLFADFQSQFGNGLIIEWNGSAAERSEADASNPFVKRILSFAVSYSFNPAQPDVLL